MDSRKISSSLLFPFQTLALGFFSSKQPPTLNHLYFLPKYDLITLITPFFGEFNKKISRKKSSNPHPLFV
jgi:hypothetical protein